MFIKFYGLSLSSSSLPFSLKKKKKMTHTHTYTRHTQKNQRCIQLQNRQKSPIPSTREGSRYKVLQSTSLTTKLFAIDSYWVSNRVSLGMSTTFQDSPFPEAVDQHKKKSMCSVSFVCGMGGEHFV